MRACAASLVALTGTASGARVAQEMGRAISRTLPCRSIIVLYDASATPPSVEAQVDAVVGSTVGGGRLVLCEEVLVQARGRAAHHLASTVIPLLVPDLPFYLWWVNRAPRASGDPAFDKLAPLADRILIDTLQAPVEVLSALVEFDRHYGDKSVLGDLNWARTVGLRSLVADAFDAGFETSSVTRVRLEASSAHRLQALLFGGWMASRLGWRDPARVVIEPRPNVAPIASLAIEDARGARLTVRREGDALRASARDRAEEARPDPEAPLAGLIAEELATPGSDRVFEESLAFAARLASTPGT